MNINDNELMEKRLELRQKLKSKLLTLSPSCHIYRSFYYNILPNSRDIDFIEKQGLDCVMNYLTENNSDVYEIQLPNICSICHRDSSENWWYFVSNENQLIYFCDRCQQIRMRNAILEQHRKSMKSAFLQAKESERRLEFNYLKQKGQLNMKR